MKINNASRTSGLVPSNQPGSRKAQRSGRVDDGSDLVQLSGLATGLAAAGAGKLDRLQSAIDAGTYRVSPEAIARGIIADAAKR